MDLARSVQSDYTLLETQTFIKGLLQHSKRRNEKEPIRKSAPKKRPRTGPKAKKVRGDDDDCVDFGENFDDSKLDIGDSRIDVKVDIGVLTAAAIREKTATTTTMNASTVPTTIVQSSCLSATDNVLSIVTTEGNTQAPVAFKDLHDDPNVSSKDLPAISNSFVFTTEHHDVNLLPKSSVIIESISIQNAPVNETVLNEQNKLKSSSSDNNGEIEEQQFEEVEGEYDAKSGDGDDDDDDDDENYKRSQNIPPLVLLHVSL